MVTCWESINSFHNLERKGGLSAKALPGSGRGWDSPGSRLCSLILLEGCTGPSQEKKEGSAKAQIKVAGNSPFAYTWACRFKWEAASEQWFWAAVPVLEPCRGWAGSWVRGLHSQNAGETRQGRCVRGHPGERVKLCDKRHTGGSLAAEGGRVFSGIPSSRQLLLPALAEPLHHPPASQRALLSGKGPGRIRAIAQQRLCCQAELAQQETPLCRGSGQPARPEGRGTLVTLVLDKLLGVAWLSPQTPLPSSQIHSFMLSKDPSSPHAPAYPKL